MIDKAGYDEDVSVSNVKIAFGSLAYVGASVAVLSNVMDLKPCLCPCRIAIALYAQFGLGKFPDTWWPVFGCVVVYCIITAFLQYYTHKYEGDAFMLTKPKKVS